jgi:hypothetical protein
MRSHFRYLCFKIFQWYNEFFNAMSFDPWNFPMKIWQSIGILTPKMGAHLGVCGFIPSHFPTLLGTWNVTPVLHSWPSPLQALALVTSPRLGLQHLIYYRIWKFTNITTFLTPTLWSHWMPRGHIGDKEEYLIVSKNIFGWKHIMMTPLGCHFIMFFKDVHVWICPISNFWKPFIIFLHIINITLGKILEKKKNHFIL